MEEKKSRKGVGGRKGLYEYWLQKGNLLRVEGWARDGMTDKQIAAKIGITTTTFYEWKNKYTKFAEAVSFGKEEVDRMVENALFKSALGYEYQEEILTKNGIQTITKVQHPSNTAQVFWLKNRKPQIWRDKQDLNITAAHLDMTEDERQARIEELKAKLQPPGTESID